jgi:hypothetical protein
MSFGLYPTDLKVPCQTFQCYERAAHFLGNEDSPQGTTQLVCDKCAGELQAQIINAAQPFIEAATEELPFTDIEPTEDPMTGVVVDLTTLKRDELVALAESKEIEVPSKATKSDIITLLEEAEHE